MATNDRDDRNERTDEATERQRAAGERRGEIIPGKGFDAGGGYGGAGNENLYNAEDSYGGQSGLGGDRMRGAYAGEPYGRPGDEDAPRDSLDAGGERRDENDRPADGDGSKDSAFGGREGEFDADSPLGGERRDPGRF